MPSHLDRTEERRYCRRDCVVFLRTNEAFGGLSNMAPGYPLLINGVRIRTTEALYQACRFPHLPNIQRKIIEQGSPMTAKMVGKPHRSETRSDWDDVRVAVMWWCLRVKLAQNWERFGTLLLSTGDRPIVEESRRDAFWGAKRVDDETLRGANVLGRLLTELREVLRRSGGDDLRIVRPPKIGNFLLFGRPILLVECRSHSSVDLIQSSLDEHRFADESAVPDRPTPDWRNSGETSLSLNRQNNPAAASSKNAVFTLDEDIAPSWIAVADVLSRVQLQSAHRPVRRTFFHQMVCLSTRAGIPTRVPFEHGPRGVSSKQIKNAMKILIESGILKEDRIGRVYAVTTGPHFDEIRGRYESILAEWDSKIQGLTKFFLRMTADQAEISCMAIHLADMYFDRKEEPINVEELIERVMIWRNEGGSRIRYDVIATAISELLDMKMVKAEGPNPALMTG